MSLKRTSALRIVGEICFFYSILSLFPAFEQWQLFMAGFVVLSLIVGIIAAGIKQLPLRLLISLVPGVCFVFAILAWFSPLLLIPMLAWVYFIVYFTIGRFNVRVYDYRKEYRRMLIVSAFFVAGNAVNLTLFSNKMLSLYSLFYLALFMLLGVIAMRSLQMGASMDKRWHAANVLTIVLFLLLAVAAAIAVYEIIVHGLPVLGLILIPFRRLFMWIYGLFGHNTEEAVAETPYIQEGALRLKQNFLISADELDADLLSKLEDFGFSRIQAQVFTIGAYLLLAAVVVAAIWLIIRLAMRGKVEAAEEKEYEDVESFTGDRRKKKARREKAQGRAQTVRKLYREYLDYLSEKGLRRTTADTSKDVLEGSERISEETTPEEEAFRRIYLKARYGADNVTEEDVAEARRILDSVRGKGKS